MNESPGFFGRIGRWFKRDHGDPAEGAVTENHAAANAQIERVETSRSGGIWPWGKRDAAITALQRSFDSFADLMNAIRDNLEKQSQRQEELANQLGKLPEIMQEVPAQQKMQSETLRVIGSHMEQQGVQQQRLAEILDKVTDAAGTQKQVLESLDTRVETLRDQDAQISDNLRSVGSAMQSVSRSSENSASVLRQLNDNITLRDSEMERILQRQNTRFTTMLAIAIALSIAALVAVCVIGYLLMNIKR